MGHPQCCRPDPASSCGHTGRAPLRREEANEDVRLSIVGALGAFLSRLDSWPASVLSRLRDGLGEKEALRRAHLRALLQVRCACRIALLPCDNAAPLLFRQCRLQATLCMLQALGGRPQARSQVGSLTAALSKVVGEGLAKPTQRVDGLAALLAAAYASTADSQVRAELERDRLWASAVQPASALLAPAALAKLPPEDAALGVRLAEELLLHVRARSPAMRVHSPSSCSTRPTHQRQMLCCSTCSAWTRRPPRRSRACCWRACCTAAPACGAAPQRQPSAAHVRRQTCAERWFACSWRCCGTFLRSRCAADPALPTCASPPRGAVP